MGFPGLTLGATPWVAWIFLAGTPRLEVVPRLRALALDLARDARDVARDTLPLRDELPELRDALDDREGGGLDRETEDFEGALDFALLPVLVLSFWAERSWGASNRMPSAAAQPRPRARRQWNRGAFVTKTALEVAHVGANNNTCLLIWTSPSRCGDTTARPNV